jgi:A/G-specific adenine glycosylase
MNSKSTFADLILNWYEKNHRNFPWRTKTDPYQILIAEIMLQRTKADQVVPVYEEFLREFPTIKELNNATLEQIQSYFARLGLFWRASLVKQMAEEVVTRFEGRIPADRDRLLSIPAVGDYMADAVLAFAYGENVAVVDTNVCRVIGRVFGLEWKGEARRKPIFKKILKELLPKGRAKEFNWAIIDHASLICLPREPLCWRCPLKGICEYAKARGIGGSDD